MNSTIFEKSFKKLLNDKNIRIVSFDIFDTLFFRKCSHPEDIFEIMGEKRYIKNFFDTALTFKKHRINAERNARIKNKHLQEITLDDIYNEFPFSRKTRDKIKEIELSIEEKYLVLNYDLEKCIDYALNKNKKVILISDMYLNKEQIINLCLKKLKNIDQISQIYVSSEYKKTKANGDLFLKVLKDEKINNDQIFHIGDNKISDNLIPSTLGIKTLYYGFDEEQESVLNNEKLFITKSNRKGNHARKLAILKNPYKKEFERFYFNLGASLFGPVLFEFSHWLKNLSNGHEILQYNFFMREGFILEKFFKKLYPNAKTNLIYASRKSTMPLIINCKDLGSVSTEIYKSFSVKDLYKSFLIEITNKKIIPYTNELLSNTNSIYINKISLFEIIQADLSSKKDLIIEKNIEQRNFLKEYLFDININKKSIFIDFGAGGTIINRMKNILSKKRFPKVNVLFYKNERGNIIQSENCTLSFLPSTNENSKSIETISRSPEFFEILLNLNLSTTQSYSKNNKKIIPNTYKPDVNKEIIEKLSNSFLAGIETFFDVIQLYGIKKNTYNREFLGEILARVISLPTKNEAKSLGDLEHDEGNSTGNTYKLIDEEKIKIVKDIGIEKIYYESIKNKAKYKHIFPWIEGVITNIEPNFLINYYSGITKSASNAPSITQLLEQIDKTDTKDFFIYGAGEFFKELFPFLKERNIKILSIIDSRAEMNEFEILGYKVTTLSKAFEDKLNGNIIIASGSFSEKIKIKITDFANKTNKNISITSIISI